MKKLKNVLQLLLIVSLTCAALMSPVAASPTALSVIFPNGTNMSIEEYFPSDTFTVSIDITEVTDLYTFEFKLRYATDLLTATEITLGSFFPSGSWVVKKEINDPLGYVWYAVSMPLGSEAGVDGSGTLATIAFTVESSGATIVDLCDTILGNSPPAGGQLIPHEVLDGAFSNIGDYPIVFFEPEPETAEVHEKVTFDASESFSNVTIVNYEWDFGDGEFDYGVIVTHAYGTPGIYTATLTVTDELSANSASAAIEVILPTYKADLVRKGAWSEHHRFSITGDEDGIQTLFGKVINSKYATESATVKVAFTIRDENGDDVPGSPFETAEVTLAPGEIADPDLTYDLVITTPGKYYVKAQCFYWDGTAWIAGAKLKSFSFTVIP